MALVLVLTACSLPSTESAPIALGAPAGTAASPTVPEPEPTTSTTVSPPPAPEPSTSTSVSPPPAPEPTTSTTAPPPAPEPEPTTSTTAPPPAPEPDPTTSTTVQTITTDKIHELRARDGGGSSPDDTLVRNSWWSWNTDTGRLKARATFGFGALGETMTARAYLESGFKPHRSSASFIVDLGWNGRVSGFNSVESYSSARVIARIRERETGRVVFEQDLLNDGVGAGYQGITAAQLTGSANRTFPLPTLDTSVIYVAEVELQCSTRVGASLGVTLCDMAPELLTANTNLDYGVTLNYWAIEYDRGICPPGVERDGCIQRQ